jgi:hypothetical protein
MIPLPLMHMPLLKPQQRRLELRARRARLKVRLFDGPLSIALFVTVLLLQAQSVSNQGVYIGSKTAVTCVQFMWRVIGVSCPFVSYERFSVEVTGVKKKNKKKSVHLQVQIRRSSGYRCVVLCNLRVVFRILWKWERMLKQR